ncbi:hypothetical protein BaRGS_00002781 [Batillaria attramentaria]|uniref:Uncharacterized protein n=1 Tax=Batillaria attramentaria TaxID=370345 RepID=A0ABD0M2B8_9CAEN
MPQSDCRAPTEAPSPDTHYSEEQFLHLTRTTQLLLVSGQDDRTRDWRTEDYEGLRGRNRFVRRELRRADLIWSPRRRHRAEKTDIVASAQKSTGQLVLTPQFTQWDALGFLRAAKRYERPTLLSCKLDEAK